MIKIGDKVKIKNLNGSLESVKDAIDMKKNYDVIDIINEYTLVIEVYDTEEIWRLPYRFLVGIEEVEKIEEEEAWK